MGSIIYDYFQIRLHKNFESLKKVISEEVLPQEYGGKGMSLEELRSHWKKLLLENEVFYQKLNSIQLQDNFKLTNPRGDELLGISGSFRKIEID